MKRLLLIVVVVCLVIPAALFAAGKYDVINVENGGSIKGKIKASAPVKDPSAPVTTDRDYCGNSQPQEIYILSADLGVKNVLVAIEDIERGKALPKGDLVVGNKECKFEPHVGIAYVGQKYIVSNSDPIFHNAHLGSILGEGKKRTLFNIALPRKDFVIEKPVKVPGMQLVKCDAHPWMMSYVYASTNPYAAVTDANGNFDIKDIPAGKYKVKIWHDGFGETSQEVEVKAGSVAELNHTFAVK